MAAVVQDVEPRVQYVATPGQTEFDFPFLVYSDSAGQGSYLVVKRTRSGTTTTLAEGTDYTISGLDTTGGGTITLTSGATASDVYTLYRDLPIQTFFTFATAGDYFATDVNKQNNLLLQMIQQLDMRLNRSLYAPLEAVISSLSLPSPEAGKVLQWNDSGTAIVNAEPDGTVEEAANAWDLESASYDNLSASVQGTALNGLFMKPDGTKLYTIDNSTFQIYQYTLSTPYVISSAVYDTVTFVNSAAYKGLYIRSDGIKLYAITSAVAVRQYTMTTPWDLSTLSYDGESFDANNDNAALTTPFGLFFSSDGTTMFLGDRFIGGANVGIYQYALSTPWNIATASYSSLSLLTLSQGTTPSGFFIKPDGSKLYQVDGNTDSIFEYDLPTAWSLSGASYSGVTLPVLSQDTQPTGIFFKSDGTRFWVAGDQNNKIFQYSITS